MLRVQAKGSAWGLSIVAKPRAKASALVQVTAEGALEVRVAAEPVDGAANAELVRFLAKVLGVPRRQVELVRGEGAKHKQVLVSGVTEDEIRARITKAIGAPAAPG